MTTTANQPTLGQFTSRHYAEHRAHWDRAAKSREAGFALGGELGLEILGDGQSVSLTHELSASSIAVLTKISRGAPLPQSVITLGALALALGTHIEADQAVIGTPPLLTGPQYPEMGSAVPLLLPTGVVAEMVREHLSAVNTIVTSSYTHQDYPLALVNEAAHLATDVRFYSDAVHGTPEADQSLSLDLRLHADDHLTLSSPNGSLPLDYLAALAGSIDAILSQFADTAQPVSALQWIGAGVAEREAAITTGPDAQADPSDTIISLFLERVAAAPDAPAYDDGTQHLTYSALAAKAAGIADHLRRSGTVPGDVVGVLVARNADWLSAILGIMMARAAYVPLDPAQPPARLATIVEQAGVRHCLDATGTGTAPEGVAQFEPIAPIPSGAPHAPQTRPEPEDIAYLLFTSGSTGVPRGVQVAHHGFTIMARDQIRAFGITASDKCAQIAAATFDASLYEIFMALLSGAALIGISDEAVRDPKAFEARFASAGVTAATITPRMLETLDGTQLPTLRTLVTAGDVAPPDLMRRYAERLNAINAYGPTETSVCASLHKINTETDPERIIPIGRPVAGSRVRICDRAGRALPPGLPGEITVTGPGVAQGYVGKDPEAHPFGRDPVTGLRRYATGDRGVYTAEGALVYLGRLDRQIKLRGYRIERSEIESTLCAHTSVRQAHIPTPRDGAPFRAYAISDSAPSPSDLHGFLAERLPEYMLPAQIVVIDALPLTPSGKVDEAALPEPQSTSITEPGTGKEATILAVWRTVLRRSDIGVQTDFFDAGGDSITAIQIASRLGPLGLTMTAADILTAGTIEHLADRAVVAAPQEKAEQGTISGPMKALPAQNWFFSQFPLHQSHFNQSLALRLIGQADEEAVRAALDTLLTHHDALRTRTDGEAVWIAQEAESELLCVEEVTAAALEQLQSGMNLSDGPMLRALMVQGAEECTLVLSVHHLAVDWVSWSVLVEDFSTAYAAACAGDAPELPAKTTALPVWADDVAASAPKLAEDAKHWAALKDMPVRPIAATNGRQGDRTFHLLSLTDGTAASIMGAANSAYSTRPQELVLTALISALQTEFGPGATAVLMEGHGRDPLLSARDVSRTVGWFTSIYPVLFDSPASDVSARIKAVKETLRTAPSQGASYLPLAYGSTGDAALRYPSPQVSFNFLGGGTASDASAQWQQTDRETGPDVHPDMTRPCPFEVSGVGTDTSLHLTLVGTPDTVPAACLERLSSLIEQELTRIADHCLGRETSEITASDVSLSGLDQDELDDLFDD